MNFMLYHRAQPFPDGHFGIAGGQAFPIQVFVAEISEYFQRLPVQFIKIVHDIFISICQIFAATMITAGLSSDGFGEHIPFDSRDMPYLVANAEFASLGNGDHRPVE
ncbi:MAG TPA: hypothetical protein VNW04_17155 [Puia sp.]|jgi:hypothetical protein|nr:hypothetical protein [Puia sp.]